MSENRHRKRSIHGVMEDKENSHPPNPNLTPTGRPFKKAVRRLRAKNGGEECSGRQLKLTQVFNTVKKSKKRTYFETDIEEAKQENKRLKEELAESHQKVHQIATSPCFNDLLSGVVAAGVPPIDFILEVLEKPPLPIVQRPPPLSPTRVDMSALKGDVNPLDNVVILEEVFSYLGNTKACRMTLKMCRLVSKTWNIMVAKRLKKCYGHVGLGNSRSVANFTETMRSSQEFPYSRFLIKGKFVPRFSTQFRRFGHHVKDLKLMGKKITFGNRNRSLAPEEISLSNFGKVVRLTPYLECLELSNLRFSSGYIQPEGFGEVQIPTLKTIILRVDYNLFLPSEVQNTQGIDLSLERIFAMAPQLTNLELEIFGRNLLANICRTILSIPTLQHLTFHSCLNEMHFQHLIGSTSSLRLTSLKLIVHLEDGRRFREFLTSQAESLESLDIHVSTFIDRTLPPTMFPVFPKLLKFKFISGFLPHQPLPFQRALGGMGDEFPVLKQLWVTSDILNTFFQRIQTLEVETLKCEYVKKVHWSSNDGTCRIKEIFPKLKKLNMRTPTDNNIDNIFYGVGGDQLEELFLDTYDPDGNGSIAAALTGISGSHWLTDRLRRLHQDPKLMQHVVLNFLQECATVGLRNLKGLKRLGILCRNQYYLSAVDDTTGYIALLSLPPLDCLELYNSKLSEKCVESLRARHKNVVIKDLNDAEMKELRDARGFL